jgi:light-regulated signal transduction histidine kinase (bacteriophytochrome)
MLTGTMDAQIQNCAAEPIRIPGGIQPHGAMIVVDPATLRVLQASANAPTLLGQGFSAGDTIGIGSTLADWIQLPSGSTLLQTTLLPNGAFNVSGHRMPQGTVLEFEPVGSGEAEVIGAMFPRLEAFADDILPLSDLRSVAASVADQVRAITRYNRVLIYSFDADWHGTVIAQSSDGTLPSYLDLRFPESDIPAQARELYRLSPLRIIPDADYIPVPLLPLMSPVDGMPMDLSFTGLRSVSPVHLQYMRNMGTYASMSISIIVDGKLWGLVSCHNQVPRTVPLQVRSACNFIAKIFSLQISSLQRGAHAAQRIAARRYETELLEQLSQAQKLPEELSRNPVPWLALTNAQGAVIVTEDGMRRVGETPPAEAIAELVEHLHSSGKDRFATDRLASIWPPGSAIADTASGVLAVSISQLHASYVIWFRPEVVRTVTWGGDPRKPEDPKERLTPRKSFEQWQEVVRHRAIAWTEAEIESADDFRNALLNFVLRRAEERAELTEELERSNKELESFSYSVSHDLRAPFRHIVGYAELLTARETSLDDKSQHYLRSIVDSALSAGRLVDDLLNFSQLGRTSVDKARIDMNKLVAEVRRSLEPDVKGQGVEWRIDPLPPAWGDGALIRQALANLIENAVKYSRGRNPAVIEVKGHFKAGEAVYSVRDNGVGFEMDYVHKLFGVFQRLHKAEDFAGTGIGLALTKRIIDRHGGRVKAEGVVNQGAKFTFTLPEGGRDRTNA